MNAENPKNPADVINSPPHYTGENGMEAIDVIEAFDLGFNLGNVVKYVLRAGKKGDRTEDLKKAAWYLNREITKKRSQSGPWTDGFTPFGEPSMTTREQAIRDEAERSIYQDREGFYRSRLGGIGSMKHGCVLDWISTMLAEHIAMTEAAERVRAATEPPASAEPSRLAFRDEEVARLNRVIAEANQQVIALTRMVANQKSTIRELRGKQEDVVARDYYAGFAKAKAAKTQDTPEEAQHGYCGDEEQRPSGVEPKLNPCREVTQEEWRSLASTWLSCRESATLVVRARVAEAMEGTVPTTRYEDVVRRLAKISHGYDRLCAKHGVKPEGGDK